MCYYHIFYTCSLQLDRYSHQLYNILGKSGKKDKRHEVLESHCHCTIQSYMHTVPCYNSPAGHILKHNAAFTLVSVSPVERMANINGKTCKKWQSDWQPDVLHGEEDAQQVNGCHHKGSAVVCKEWAYIIYQAGLQLSKYFHWIFRLKISIETRTQTHTPHINTCDQEKNTAEKVAR